MKLLYGPLYSRRLGMSLGVDTIPHKTCTFNCIYCHDGETTCLTVDRKDYLPPSRVLEELKLLAGQREHRNRRMDYITFAGSGEPTLNLSLGRYIRFVKSVSPVQVAVITNSSLLWKESVREELMAADLIVPSLDAATEETFLRINRPCPGLQLDKIIEGLKTLCRDFTGSVWLEVLLCEGINDGEEELRCMSRVIEELNVQKVQLNTVDRPPSLEEARPLSRERLVQVAALLGPKTETVEDFLTPARQALERGAFDRISSLLMDGQPRNLEQLCRRFRKSRQEMIKILTHMEKEGLVERCSAGSTRQYRGAKGIKSR